MWSLMKDIAREMGVRTDVPFKELTEKERDIVFHGPAVKKNIIYQNKTSGAAGDMDFTYFNATYTVENALSKVKDEKGMKRVEKFLRQGVCPDCGGTRLSEVARAPRLRGISLAEACTMTLSELSVWVEGVPDSLPEEMRPMAVSICESFQTAAKRLMDLGLSYLTWIVPHPHFPQGNGRECSLRGRSEIALPACCMCSMSHPSVCIFQYGRPDRGDA